MTAINFSKSLDGLVPAIIQDAYTGQVLMLGYMNPEAYEKTLKTNRVTFYSRKKQRLWMKGEESKNYLELVEIKLDCDQDALLVKVNPTGPVCHKGSISCWNENENESPAFLAKLQQIISKRKKEQLKNSYTSDLFKKGKNKIVQKVGEEAVELLIEAMDGNEDLFKEECADLLFHLLILIEEMNISIKDIEKKLILRHLNKTKL